MLTLTKNEVSAQKTIYVLAGAIDEECDLAILLPLAPESVIHLAAVTRLNSTGAKNWIQLVNSDAAKSVKLYYQDMPSIFVEQFNMIENFGGAGTVLSLQIPYFCASCNSNYNGTATLDQLKQGDFNPPPVVCPKCKGSAEFDDTREEYFGFLIG